MIQEGRPETGSREVAQWATFFLAGEMFALAVEDVQEVLMYQPLTPVPHAPAQMVGMLNLRGQIMPAIDLRRRLGFSPRTEGENINQLVIKTSEGPISVLVDEIGDVLELSPSGWCRPPDTLSGTHREFVFGVFPIEQHVVLGLTVERLGFDDEPAGKTELRRPGPEAARGASLP